MDSDLLDDLNDLGSGSEDEAPISIYKGSVEVEGDGLKRKQEGGGEDDMAGASDDGDDDEDDDGDNMAADANDHDDEEAYNTESLLSLVRQTHHSRAVLGKLRSTEKYMTHMKAISAAMDTFSSFSSSSSSSSSSSEESTINILNYAVIEDSPDYRLVVNSQRILQELEQEKDNNILRVIELYSPRFPELDILVPNKVSYIKAVYAIGNESDIYNVNLSDFLPSNTIMVVNMSASNTPGTILSPQVLQQCMHACQEVLMLESDKDNILQFLGSRMPYIAPNLCALIGASSAATLLGLAGGLVLLSKIPACNVISLGRDNRHRSLQGMGTSSALARSPAGSLTSCDLVQTCPPSLRRKLLKVLSAKVILSARLDAYGDKSSNSSSSNSSSSSSSSADEIGQAYRKEILSKIDKWKKPDKARTKRALPVPVDGTGKKHKRGGRRARRFKELYAQTQVGELQNKLSMSSGADLDGKQNSGYEYSDSAMGIDSGMLGNRSGNGRIRATQAIKKDIPLTKKQKRKHADANNGKNTYLASGNATSSDISYNTGSSSSSGLTSTYAFTPVLGLELANPGAVNTKEKNKVDQANSRWFSESTGFASVMPRVGK